ncbi:hypothetical protein Vretimale_11263 [Volvox reticuliferus]|uniref:NADH:ubiquinone oxidoreductase intermediate-associated protein 30 domain-containing protein n=1 Tax=Volvox reticuliferus TaxID=1737510 RepID=A0A8J4GGF4_9CHLO|nr:hypothetical protein Vretifemale_12089 [Volvox reticuliferus]GIM07177.1 hypothetical protein Vretimale_11263 [Volvox reticuliferus]
MPRSASAGSGLFRRAWHAVDRFLSVDLTPEPKLVYAFKTQRDVAAWNVFSDASFGGLSTATFGLSDCGKTAVFSGTYSKEVQADSKLIRSGYCGINQVVGLCCRGTEVTLRTCTTFHNPHCHPSAAVTDFKPS